MTVTENLGSLVIEFTSGTTTRRESIRNIRTTATDQDLYDIAVAIANLISDTVAEIRRVSTKSYSA